MNFNIKVLAVYIHRPVKITLHLVNKMQCGGRSSEWLLSLLLFPVVPPAAGNPAETRESACLKHEVTVDAAALNYPPPTNQRPSRRLLSSNHPAGSQTYLQTCYCMCSESHTQRSIHAPYERNGTTAASNLEKRGFHVLWLQRVTRSWPRPRARLSIPLLCRRYMGTWLWSMRGNEERGTTCGGQCWCFHSANPSPCELNSAAPLKSLKCSVWTHHHAVWACEGKKRISSNFLGTNLRCPAFSFMLCDKFCLDKRQLTQRAPQAGLISVDFSLFTG